MLRKEKKRKSRGWVPFGYKYLGPGNDLHRGKPTTKGDAAAQKHDWKYHEIEQTTSRNPKFQYYEEDDDFIKEVGQKHYSEWIAQNIFKAKRRLADLGWLEDMRPRQKAKRETTPIGNPFITPPKKKAEIPVIIPKQKKKLIIQARKRLSFENLQPQGQVMVDTGNNKGSGTETGLTETPVDRVEHVYRGPPDQMFASLPFYNETTVNQSMVIYDMAWRPTSVYDCQVDYGSTVDLNAGAGSSVHFITNPFNSTDVTTSKARWFDYYASIYKYYHVIACRYEIYIENLSSEDIWVHLMPTNDVYPPTGATNVDMLQWNDCDSQMLTARSIAITSTGALETNEVNTNVDMDETNATAGGTANFETGNHLINQIGKKAHIFSGTYRTGDYGRQIRLDANVENWTAVTTNPTLVERLLLRIKTYWESTSLNDGVDRNRSLKFKVNTKMEYLVEFKELKDGLKYPTNDQPWVATLNTAN